MIDVGSTLEGICTRLRDGVHTTTDEVCLTNIVGRDNHLQLLDSIDRDRVTTTREVRRQSKVVVEVGTVDSEVSRTSVATCKTHAIAAIRRQAGNVSDRTTDCWQVGDLGIVNVRRSTSLLCGELGCLTAYHDFCQLSSVLREPYGEVVGLSELEFDALNSLRLETDVRDCHLIRATRTHTLNGKAAGRVSNCRVTSTRRLVYSHHGSADDLFAVLVVESHLTCHT